MFANKIHFWIVEITQLKIFSKNIFLTFPLHSLNIFFNVNVEGTFQPIWTDYSRDWQPHTKKLLTCQTDFISCLYFLSWRHWCFVHHQNRCMQSKTLKLPGCFLFPFIWTDLLHINRSCSPDVQQCIFKITLYKEEPESDCCEEMIPEERKWYLRSKHSN